MHLSLGDLQPGGLPTTPGVGGEVEAASQYLGGPQAALPPRGRPVVPGDTSPLGPPGQEEALGRHEGNQPDALKGLQLLAGAQLRYNRPDLGLDSCDPGQTQPV